MSLHSRRLSDRWYRSNIYMAWCNRCIICLFKPNHGFDSEDRT